jgi:hypothetical protein
MRFFARVMAAGFALYAWCACAQPASVPPKAKTAFVRVHVVPMDREQVLRDQTVIVEDGRIVAIGPSVPVPGDAHVVDGKGEAWLLPGLADMHNHLDSRQDLAVQLALGITTALHMGEARNSFVGRTRAAVADGEVAGPRVLVALAVDGSPRYGHLVVTDEDDARATVRVAKANGYDFIKLYNNLSPAAFEALAREARAQGIPLAWRDRSGAASLDRGGHGARGARRGVLLYLFPGAAQGRSDGRSRRSPDRRGHRTASQAWHAGDGGPGHLRDDRAAVGQA